MNPATGHPLDCECCRIQITRTSGGGRKRTREDADLSTFLPEPVPEPPGEEEEEAEGEEAGEEEAVEEAEPEPERLINESLFKLFETHVEKLDAARLRRIEALSFKSALEDDGQEEVNQDATQDEIDGLGVWLPGDEFQGDVNYRTLQKLLTRVDQRGYERSAQQLEARPRLFLPPGVPRSRVRGLRAVPRGLHEGRGPRHLPRQLGDGAAGHHEEVWVGEIQLGSAHQVQATTYPRAPGPHQSRDSRVVCRVRSTPRRFGKTFSCARCSPHSLACALTNCVCVGSIAIFCACLALAFGLEIGAPQGVHPHPLSASSRAPSMHSRLLSSPSRVAQAA